MHLLSSFQKICVASSLVCAAALSSMAPNSALANDYMERLIEGRTVFEIKTLDSKSETIKSSFTLDDEEASKPYALVVDPLAAGTGPFSLNLNGSSFLLDPVPGEEGRLWFLLPPEGIVKGENQVSIDMPGGFHHAAVASLESNTEADHFGLFVHAIEPFAEPARDPQQNLIDVKHIDLELETAMQNEFLDAVVEVTVESLDDSLTECVLDLDNAMNVSEVIDVGSSSILSHIHSSGRLYIEVPSGVTSGDQFTLRIAYSGFPSRGYFRTTHGSGVPLVYTYNQPYDARGWLPCKDVPSDKFTYEAHITVPSTIIGGYGLTPVTNGAFVSQEDNGNGTITFHWNESFKIASYLISIACTNYRPSTGTYTALDNTTTMDVTHFIYPEEYAGASGEITNTITVLDYYADTFGEYPFLTEKYSTAGWNISSGMEHQTCTSMPDNNLAQPFHRRSIHELAHMWFGDMVTYETYDHLWLAEGWASYCEALTYGHLSGDAAYHSYMDNWEDSVRDERPLISPNQDAFDFYTFRTAYYKGAWVLHMLRHAIGDTDFFAATKNYLASASHQYDVANSDDFQTFFDAQTGEDMSWFFDQWLTRTSRPSYEWAWTTRSDSGDTVIDVTINQTQVDSIYVMAIDFGVQFDDASYGVYTVFNDQQNQTLSINVGTKAPNNLEFDPDNWLLETNQLVGIPTGVPDLRYVVTDQFAGNANVAWWPYSESGLIGFRLYMSPDGATGWSLVADELTLTPASTSHQVTGFSAGNSAYFRLAPVVATQGQYSDIYGAHFSGDAEKVLVIDGYDRWNSQTLSGGLNHAIAVIHGKAIAANGIAFDTCDNDALLPVTTPNPADYAAMDWLLGDESTIDESFSDTEQALVSGLLDAGGKLFVSGNEIGWDLDNRGGTSDQTFYHDYLKAAYLADDSNDYSVVGSGGDSIFRTDTFSYGFGDSPYLPAYPDVIMANGSTSSMEYSGGGVAAIQYTGTFGSKQGSDGAVVYMGFGFETLYPEADRTTVMGDILDYFGLGADSSVGDLWMMY